jgi:hypothetical protein
MPESIITKFMSFLFLSQSIIHTFKIDTKYKAGAKFALSVPLLSVSMNADTYNYLPRLLCSIDYPIDNIIIQIGNNNSTLRQTIINSIKNVLILKPRLQIDVSEIMNNPGSANGFNFGLRGLMNMTHKSWVLIVNNDIAFYPGVLQRLSNDINKNIRDNPLFGIGFTSLCCGGQWLCMSNMQN